MLDISGMFSKCFAGGIEVVRVRHCLRNFTPPKKENKKNHLKIIFPPSFFLSLSLLFKYELMCIWSVAFLDSVIYFSYSWFRMDSKPIR